MSNKLDKVLLKKLIQLNSKKELFIKLAKPDSNGISRFINRSEFIGAFFPLNHDNGCDWGRRDGSLAKEFKFLTVKKNGKISKSWESTEEENLHVKSDLESYLEKTSTVLSSGSKVILYKLQGFQNIIFTRPIRQDIRKELSKKPCPILGSSNCIEIDHKNGRYNDHKVLKAETQTIDDFQPLSKHANDAKRQHCKDCKKTGVRFDAKKLHFPISYTQGCAEFGDSDNPNGCLGCYWYDIEDFHQFLIKK